MSVALSVQEFRRTFAYPFVSITSIKPVMVQIKAKQIQIAVADMVAKKEVVPQAAVEVFYQGTGTRHVSHGIPYRTLQPIVM